MPQPASSRELASVLRNNALRAADRAAKGCALIFAATPGDVSSEASARLRAAAGFASADAACSAAGTLRARVEDTLRSAESSASSAPSQFANSGFTHLVFLPLRCHGQVHGVLAVGSRKALDEDASAELEQLAETTALHLDHAQQAAEAALRRDQAEDSEGDESCESSDAMLQLSEALFARDIELLQSNEELGKIGKLKNDFIEKMSRELRTPLNHIIEAIISVLAGENDAISDHAKSMLRSALDQGTVFQRTLENILDLWRIKQQELPVEIQDVSFSEIVDEAIFSVQDTLGDKPVRIEKAFENFPKIKTDLAKLNQILFLLLDNAAKFTAKGAIRIEAHIDQDVLSCGVADTGIGICADDQEYVFDEFFQVDELSSSTYRGAGLGLALVRDFVDLLEGQLSLESEAGQGTAIRFSIPVRVA